MTVAAVLLFQTIEGALADAAGRPAVRRIVESAWAGGATPIIVVAYDRDGAVAMALAGSPAVLAQPAPAEGALGQVHRGIAVATEQVSGTDAVLVWPGRMAWVDAETVTSLIEAHGSDPDTLLRPAHNGTAGLPVLLPLSEADALTALRPGEPPDQVLLDIGTGGIPARTIEVGDPGVVHDISVALDDLPPYAGPPEPVGGPPPEWGAAAAEVADEGPLEGPALAPYAPAGDETSL